MSDTTFFNRLRPYATEQKTVSSSAVSPTTALVDNTANYPDFKAAGAVIEVRGDSVYYTTDGSTPSSTNGILAYVGAVIPIAGYQKIKNLKAIRVTTDATLNIQYYKN